MHVIPEFRYWTFCWKQVLGVTQLLVLSYGFLSVAKGENERWVDIWISRGCTGQSRRHQLCCFWMAWGYCGLNVAPWTGSGNTSQMKPYGLGSQLNFKPLQCLCQHQINVTVLFIYFQCFCRGKLANSSIEPCFTSYFKAPH